MQQILITACLSIMLLSCTQHDTKQKETEPEIKEMDTTKESALAKTPAVVSLKTNGVDSAAALEMPLVVTPLAEAGDIGHVTFTQKTKTVFYYDAKLKKGKIKLNGIEYAIKLQYQNGTYKLTGDNVTITAANGKFEEMESDCSYGKFLFVTITLGTQTLKLDNVGVQDCSSMVE